MERYIGLYAHSKTCTFVVLGPSGRRLRSEVVETNGSELVEFVRSVPGCRHRCLEEGAQSAWLYETLERYIDSIVIAVAPKRQGPKNDERDARSLAEALRTGSIEKSVLKAPKQYARLRELARVHTMVVRDVVRVKLRLKSMYRSRGVASPGNSVFGSSQRQDWLAKLPPSCKPRPKSYMQNTMRWSRRRQLRRRSSSENRANVRSRKCCELRQAWDQSVSHG